MATDRLSGERQGHGPERERRRRSLHCPWSKLCVRHGLSLLNKHRNLSCDSRGESHE